MITMKDSKYIVMDTETKEVISEHPFDENDKTRKSEFLAKDAAYISNAEWKRTKTKSK